MTTCFVTIIILSDVLPMLNIAISGEGDGRVYNSFSKRKDLDYLEVQNEAYKDFKIFTTDVNDHDLCYMCRNQVDSHL